MKFNIEFNRAYPHAIDKVWRALTDSDALGAWLMETNFVPETGRSFEMLCKNRHGDTDTYLCSVVEMEPPHRMVWSWLLDGKQEEGKTHVEFRLQEVSGVTHLTVRHSGDRDALMIERFKGGWPVKLQQLDETLQGNRS